jgi:hypothetical protein
MKNLPCLLTFSAVLGLILLAAAAVLGVSLPFDRIAPAIVGFSCVAGVVGFLMVDYAPSRSGPTVAARVAQPKRVLAPSAVSQRRISSPAALSYDDTITLNLTGTVGMRTVSGTVSLS